MHKRLLLSFLIPFSVTALFPQNDGPVVSSSITLEKINTDRIADARAHYRRRMRHVQYTLWGVLGGLAGAGAAGLLIAHVKSKPSQEQAALKQLQRNLGQYRVQYSSCPAPAESENGLPIQIVSREQQQDETRRVKALAAAAATQNGGSQASVLSGWSGALKLAVGLGVAGAVMTIGTQVLQVLAGTLEELINLWVRGYQYWYNVLEHEVKTTFTELRDSLNQARKVANSGFDINTLKGAGRRYASQARATGTHYRADITTMYQVGLGKLERLVSLMYLMSSKENHAVVDRHVVKLAGIVERFKDSLQYDLNENTHGTLTHYSNHTMELFHEMDENIQIFLTTYRVYLTE